MCESGTFWNELKMLTLFFNNPFIASFKSLASTWLLLPWLFDICVSGEQLHTLFLLGKPLELAQSCQLASVAGIMCTTWTDLLCNMGLSLKHKLESDHWNSCIPVKLYSCNSTVPSLSFFFTDVYWPDFTFIHWPCTYFHTLLLAGWKGWVFRSRRRKREEEVCSLAQTSCGVCDCAYFHGRSLITSLNAVFPPVFASRKSQFTFLSTTREMICL